MRCLKCAGALWPCPASRAVGGVYTRAGIGLGRWASGVADTTGLGVWLLGLVLVLGLDVLGLKSSGLRPPPGLTLE